MGKELQIPAKIDLAAFISSESHDLTSPFNRALGFIKLVQHGFDDPITKDAVKDLAIAYQNTQHSLKLMDALVDVARLVRCEIDPVIQRYPLHAILQQTIADWTRNYHKKNNVNITFSAPDKKILVDEILIRRCFANWISYVNEFVRESASVSIQVEDQVESCLFMIRSFGVKIQEPPECDLTLYGFVARGILDLHQGDLIKLGKDDQGAYIRFSLPNAA